MSNSEPGATANSAHLKISKPRQCICYECFYRLTGDFYTAIVLNQFIRYQRTADLIEEFIVKENQRRAGCRDIIDPIALTEGWFYKSVDEVCEDLMHPCSRSATQKDIQTLIDKGWLQARFNPVEKFNRTKQYRVDLELVVADLSVLKFTLPE